MRIGYGAMQLEKTTREDAAAVLRRAAELGVKHFDTAGFYGEANERLREALHPYDGLDIVTKVGAVRDGEGQLVPAQRPEQLRAAVEDDLRRLGTDRLAAVYLRRLDGPPGIVATGDDIVDIDSQLAELSALRDEGKLDGIGLSNVTVEQLEHALPAGIAIVQNRYNLLEREDAPLLEACAREGIAWAPYFPLGSAFPGFPKVTDDPVVIDVAAELGATPAQVGLAWLLRDNPHTLVIAGTRSVAHLEENVAAGELALDAATMARLSAGR